jgi:hypothetical protein
MKQEQIIHEVAKEMGMTLRDDEYSITKNLLVTRINELVATNFDKLISILYRMDVNETKLKLLLKNNPDTDAGLLIANLMIERQAQKIKSRQQFSQRDNDIEDENKW